MLPVVSREQIRAFDRHAIEELGIPSLLLMENAGRGAAEVIAERLGKGARVAVVAGPGNNGGDGFVVARRLLVRGLRPEVHLTSERDRLSGDAKVMCDAWTGLGGPLSTGCGEQLERLASALEGVDLIVDALLGTGLDRDVKGALADVIERINRAPADCIALDIPSGLCADTGRELGVAVHARCTVTFAHPKLGLLTPRGAAVAGEVRVVDIGVPPPLVERVGVSAQIVERQDVRASLRRRSVAIHKGEAGRVVVMAGSAGKTGAALLSAQGALRGGAGLVTIAAFSETARALDQRVTEVMTQALRAQRWQDDLGAVTSNASSIVVGPGLGLSKEARQLVDHIVFGHEGPVVVDADGLTHLSGRLRELRKAPGPRLLTPHPGEMGKLLETSAGDVEADRYGALGRAVEESQSVILLKGAHTLVGAPASVTTVNPTGAAVMATAGAGDVLSGLTAALLASSDDAHVAGYMAAFIHGLSGERWANAHGADRGMLATELADGLPGAFAEVIG